MRKLFLISILTTFTFLALIGQDDVVKETKQDCKKQIDSGKLTKKTIHYLSESFVDSTIFQKDSIVFPKEKDYDKASFEFKNDSTFIIAYNKELDTLELMNKETGEVTKKVVTKSDKIKGKWESDNPEEYIDLILDEGKKIRYKICKTDNQIVFKKQ